jgi:uncharacterized protein (TIRG00374 family)
MKLGRLLRVLISLIVLAIVVAGIGADHLLDALRTINPLWFLIAVLIHLLGVAIRAYRWSMLIAALGSPVPFGRLFYLYMAGTFFNTFLPTGIGGDVVKIIELAPERGGAEAFSSVFADRLIGVLGSALIALAVAIADPGDVPEPVVIAVIAISVGVLLASWLLTQRRLLDRLIWQHRFADKLPGAAKLKKVSTALTSYSIGALARATLISLPFTLTLIVSQYALAIGLGIDAPLRYFALFIPMVALVQLLPISFNGLGVREGTVQVLFGSVGIADAQAVAMSLLYYVVRVGIGLIGGLMYLIGSLRSDRRTAASAEEDRVAPPS